ncbi:hypothetical protein HZB78_02010 [Candidatus Collierbacteria bacterium]|nr:hypothetical protein [Candidatus Collierbacteria bacterium]
MIDTENEFSFNPAGLLHSEGVEGLSAFTNELIKKALGTDSKAVTLDTRELAKIAVDSKLNPKELGRANLSAIGAIFADIGIWSLQCEDRTATSFVPGSHQRQIGYVDRLVKNVLIGPVKDPFQLKYDWELKSIVKPDQTYALRVNLEDDLYADGNGLIGGGDGNIPTGSFRLFQYHEKDKSGKPILSLDIHKDEAEKQKNEPGVDFVQYKGAPAFSARGRPLVPRKATLRIDKDSQVFLGLNIPSSRGSGAVDHTFDLAIDPLVPRVYGVDHLVGDETGFMPMVGYSVRDAKNKPVKESYGTQLVGVKKISGSTGCQGFQAIHWDNRKQRSAVVSFPRLPSHLLLATEDKLEEAIDGLKNYAWLLEILFSVETG